MMGIDAACHDPVVPLAWIGGPSSKFPDVGVNGNLGHGDRQTPVRVSAATAPAIVSVTTTPAAQDGLLMTEPTANLDDKIRGGRQAKAHSSRVFLGKNTRIASGGTA